MANDSLMIVTVPKDLRITNILSIIGKLNCIFLYKGKRRPQFALDFSRVERSDILGILLTYKLLEYSLIHKCFLSPQHNLYANKALTYDVNKFGFGPLIKALTGNIVDNDSSVQDKNYKALRVELSENCLVAPIALLRSDYGHSDDVIKSQYEPKISSYYSPTPKVVDMILQVFTEVLNNFWSHTRDEKSVIAGYGNLSRFEIVCADNGYGIDGTVSRSDPNIKGAKAMKKAMENGYTSKQGSNHMGYGLWFINKVIERTKGVFVAISNNIYYENTGGKVCIRECPKWEGTVVYIKLPTKNPYTISDIERESSFLGTDIKINFI